MFILSLVIIVSPGFEAIDITHNIYIIFTTFIVSIISSYLIEKNQRESYLSKYIQEDLNDTFIEETLKNMKKDKLLKQQSRLAQMGEMISMIAHQWRQPLAAISSTSNNITLKIAMGELDNDELLQEVMLISDYAQHLSKTIDDFRGFMKDDKIKVKTRFKHLVNSTLNIAKTSLENKHIEVVTSFNIEDDVPSFMTYQSELKQVILNLLKNAEDILLEKKIQNPTIRIETYFKNDTYILKVKDNAGGIPEDIMDKIFDPYFSTKLEKDGTGLGLYMSKTIVEEHCGGKLKASNDKDGAVFTVELYS
jgi:signal transduction histidine kinase